VSPKIAGIKWMFIPLKNVSIGIDPYPIDLVNPKIAGIKWMFIPLKNVSIGIDPYPIDYRICWGILYIWGYP